MLHKDIHMLVTALTLLSCNGSLLFYWWMMLLHFYLLSSSLTSDVCTNYFLRNVYLIPEDQISCFQIWSVLKSREREVFPPSWRGITLYHCCIFLYFRLIRPLLLYSQPPSEIYSSLFPNDLLWISSIYSLLFILPLLPSPAPALHCCSQVAFSSASSSASLSFSLPLCLCTRCLNNFHNCFGNNALSGYSLPSP